jgi:hypothetical protein
MRAVKGALALLVLGATLVAATGCGGDDEPPAEAWANDVCTAISDWRTTIEGIVSDLQSQLTSPDAGAAVKDAIASGVDATTQLKDELQGIGPPETEAGEEAKQALDDFADQAAQTADDVEAQAQKLPDSGSVSELLSQLTPMAASLESLAREGQSQLQDLEQLDPSGEIQDGVDNAEACQSLMGNS